MDVALDRLMGLFEMVIKLRCEEVEIALASIDRNGRSRKKVLNTLIEKLIETALIDDIKSTMYHVRRMRNYSAHPKRNDTVGTFALRPLTVTINVINQLFMPQEDHIENRNEVERFNNEFSFEEDELFKLPTENGIILVYSPKLRHSFKVNNEWIRAVSLEPVLENTFDLLSNHRMPNPILHFFKDVSFADQSINAYDVISNQSIKIERTNKSQNIDYFNEHIQELTELEPKYLLSYKNMIADQIDWMIQEYIYTSCWN